MAEEQEPVKDRTKKARPGASGVPAGDAIGPGLSQRPVLESLPVGVIVFDADLKILYANHEAKELIDIRQSLDTSLAAGTDQNIWNDWTEKLKAVLSSGEQRTFESVEYASQDKRALLRIVLTTLRTEPQGKVRAAAALLEDVSDKVRLQKQLLEAERLAAVGRLASKVAHELNNPMDGILRYINLTLRIVEHEQLEKPREYLLQCRQGLMRMVHIVSELLEFSRSRTAPFDHVPIEQTIEEAVKTMEAKAEAFNIRILRRYDRSIPEIRAGNLFQVFCNLTKNAIDAMGDGGELSISTSLQNRDTIVVQFQDTGVGFAPDDRESIFEPFFTTKEKGKGTGLGLAICRDIVESRNGTITAESAPGGGSRFTVYLPAGR